MLHHQPLVGMVAEAPPNQKFDALGEASKEFVSRNLDSNGGNMLRNRQWIF